jgi:hypothetical protein
MLKDPIDPKAWSVGCRWRVHGEIAGLSRAVAGDVANWRTAALKRVAVR